MISSMIDGTLREALNETESDRAHHKKSPIDEDKGCRFLPMKWSWFLVANKSVRAYATPNVNQSHRLISYLMVGY